MTSDHLDNDTERVDDATIDDSPLAADHVGKITSDESTEEGTTRENRDDQRLVAFTESGGLRALDGANEVERTVDTVDITGVITEEDTTEGGKGAEKVGLPGDGGLDRLDIVGGLKGDGALAAGLVGPVVDRGHC